MTLIISSARIILLPTVRYHWFVLICKQGHTGAVFVPATLHRKVNGLMRKAS